jgi:glycosyltransferase involved in cell wall biosynthesis
MARLRENPLRARGALAFVLAARRLLSRHGPFEQLISHWLIPCAWPIGLGKAQQLEAVAHGSDVRLLCALPRALRQHVARALIHEKATLRCVSEELRDMLIDATTPLLRSHTRVEPVRLELGLRVERAEARARFGLRPPTRLVLVVSRLIPDKRVGTVLQAVAYLPDVHVVVVGGGPELERLRRDFPGVRFTAELPRPQALEWMSAADVVVSASQLEGAPTVVREARALGIPVVAWPAGDLPRWAAEDAGLWLVSGLCGGTPGLETRQTA